MSLTSMMNERATRNRFKAIAPCKELFTVDPRGVGNGGLAFSKAELLVPPDPFFGGAASRVGTAFDYLLRAQIARWRGEGFTASMSWVATEGLKSVLDIRDPSTATPLELDGETRLSRRFLARLAAEEANHSNVMLFHRYDEACDAWELFAGGKEISRERMILSAWLLAGLEAVYRAGGFALDPMDVIAPPTAHSVDSIAQLWSVLEANRDIFADDGAVAYNPSFGQGSTLIGGADADFAIGQDLFEIKARVKSGYSWQHAAQLAGYLVLAAMTGSLWPIRRLGIYQARHGRMLWIDAAELACSKDLVSFGEWLLSSRRTFGVAQDDRKALRGRLRENLAALRASRDEATLPPAQVGIPAEATGPVTPARALLAVLREHSDREIPMDDFMLLVGQPHGFTRDRLHRALAKLIERGQVERVMDATEDRSYWRVLRQHPDTAVL